jgi:hypothetical protein
VWNSAKFIHASNIAGVLANFGNAPLLRSFQHLATADTRPAMTISASDWAASGRRVRLGENLLAQVLRAAQK